MSGPHLAVARILAAVGLAALPAALGAQQSYPLTCRGGGGMVIAVHHKAVAITFRPAAQGAGARPPQPGECAWVDRGWRPGEAADIVWWAGDGVEVATIIRPIDSPEGSSVVRLDFEGDPAKVRGYRYLDDAMRTASVFHLRVYQKGHCSEPGVKWAWERRMTFGRCFWVTRLGP